MTETSKEQRLVFGDVAEIYDRVRPGYPEELVDDVMACGDLAPGERAIEVGPGTGRATLLFAARGLEITGVEPSAEMAAVARDRLAAHPEVIIEEGLFENYDGPAEFRLAFGGQAWHWVPREVRYSKAHEVLGDDGVFAWFFNRPDWSGSEDLRAALDEIYERLAPDIPSRGPGSAWTSISSLDEEIVEEISSAHFVDPLSEGPLFTDVEWREYRHTRRYPTADYLDLLRTQSDHRMLEPEHMERLLDAVADVFDDGGGAVELGYRTGLYLARKA